MSKLKNYPRDLGRLDHEIQVLDKQIKENADLEVIGLAAARIHLDCMGRILACLNQLDLVLVEGFCLREVRFDENVAPTGACLRMLGELTRMLLAHMDGFLNCFGGPATIGIQQLQKWAEGNPIRTEFLREQLARAVVRAKRSRR